MGKRSNKRSKTKKRSRARSSSSSSSSSTSARTPSPPRKRKVSRKVDTGTVSTSNQFTLNNIIPEFDPLRDEINAWLSIIQSYAKTFSWSDEMTRYQALNKLKGSAKVWYDSLLRTDSQWPSWKWKEWKRKLTVSFQIRRNMFELLKEVIDKKPAENQSLYEFYFEQKCKIDRLGLEFSEPDIISIIVGNIGDSGIGASIEASNFTTCDSLASFLHGRIYKPKSAVAQSTSTVTTTPSTNQSVGAKNNVQDQPRIRNPIKCYTCGGNHKHPRNKIIKNVVVNGLQNEAFIDQGSSCSLISESIVKKNAWHSIPLPTTVTLKGFSKKSSESVTHKITVPLQLDSVKLENVDFYVIDDLMDCDILIGRNVTEHYVLKGR
ncbi:aspartyl protease domain-containing protein [Phthorimaea operculella]|nr:aspartyl protease domain-containing protein [Phthorimaea operculella]